MWWRCKMPNHTSSKRKQKILNYTSEDCVDKLLNRGYTLDIELRNTLDALLVEEQQKGTECHTRAFWLSQKVAFPTHSCAIELCACLCPLYIHNINYINLVIILPSVHSNGKTSTVFVTSSGHGILQTSHCGSSPRAILRPWMTQT